jgi:hypothetical protein
VKIHQAHGGKVVQCQKKATLMGENPGSKYTKAKSQYPILDEDHSAF